MKFAKYQGTGNDFILIDGEREFFDSGNTDLIRHLCDRRFGIGADGLILIHADPGCDFRMDYFNADGGLGSLCGNGSRCAVKFALEKNYFTGKACRFIACDGLHTAYIDEAGEVAIKMADVTKVDIEDKAAILDTGSPHYVVMVEDLRDIDVVDAGRAIRYSPRFREKGINVNFVEIQEKGVLKVATYERGVENETLSCGTGVTASVLGSILLKDASSGEEVRAITKGGELKVRYHQNNKGFQDIWLIGPAEKVFEGIYS